MDELVQLPGRTLLEGFCSGRVSRLAGWRCVSEPRARASPGGLAGGGAEEID